MVRWKQVLVAVAALSAFNLALLKQASKSYHQRADELIPQVEQVKHEIVDLDSDCHHLIQLLNQNSTNNSVIETAKKIRERFLQIISFENTLLQVTEGNHRFDVKTQASYAITTLNDIPVGSLRRIISNYISQNPSQNTINEELLRLHQTLSVPISKP